MAPAARMPNFLVIGAAKCGTDALCNYLGQHPDVYLSPNKEPMFFVAEGQDEIPFRGPGDREVLARWEHWIPSLQRYQALFAGVTTERAVGEGSTWYIYDERAPERIHRHLPNARLIAVLRNPVDRAYSAFTMLQRDGRETTADFARALEAEDKRVQAGWEPIWHYRRMGFYANQVERYRKLFETSQLKFLIYDDFNSRPGEVVREVFGFLGVNDRFEPDVSGRHNVSLVPKHPTFHRLVAGQNPIKAVLKPLLPARLRRGLRSSLASVDLVPPLRLDSEVRSKLIDIFRADIARLEELLGRSLSAWLEPNVA